MSNRIKIIYFYQYYGTNKGGWSTRVYENTRRWVNEGAEVTVITSLYDKSDLKANGFLTNFNIEGVNVKLINVRMSNKDGKLKRIFNFFSFALMAIWYALTAQYDAIICSSGPLTIGIPGVLAKKIRNKPFVFEIRDLWPEGAIELGVLTGKTSIKFAKWLAKICYNSADTIVALSEGQMQHVQKDYPNKLVYNIPNAADNELASQVTAVDVPLVYQGKKLVLYTGTLGLIDKCEQLVRLAEELKLRKREDIEIIIIGDGKERIELESLAKSLNLRNIHFLGLTSKENVMKWLKVADVSLLTYKNLSFLDTVSPNKLFDAFAIGLPVVQNTQGWIKTLLKNSGAGLTFPHDNQVAFADAVLKILDDKELSDRMRIASKNLAMTKYDRSTLATEMLNIVKQTIVTASNVTN
ncbi:MAG: glycosyltransferase family 4 protein [Bacteroidota bacterium]|nr:glycosyltransferase family 4 protein [Bacteroidota bacterium]